MTKRRIREMKNGETCQKTTPVTANALQYNDVFNKEAAKDGVHRGLDSLFATLLLGVHVHHDSAFDLPFQDATPKVRQIA